MNACAADRPEYAWLREFKEAHGTGLLRRYGAHAIGIGWKLVAGVKTDQLVLRFYVERKIPTREITGERIPPSIPFVPSGSDRLVSLGTDVVESPPAELE